MTKITDDDLRKIAAEVEREYGMGGLSGGIYEDFALDVAKRAIAMERERCAAIARCEQADANECGNRDAEDAARRIADQILA
jgi:hypothetical protein